MQVRGVGKSMFHLRMALSAIEHGKIVYLDMGCTPDIGAVCTVEQRAHDFDTFELDRLRYQDVFKDGKNQPNHGWYRKFEKKRF